MPNRTTRFHSTGRFAVAGLIGALIFLGLLLIVAAAFIVTALLSSWSWKVLGIGILLILGMLLAGLWSVVLYGVIRIVKSNEAEVARCAGRLGRIETITETHVQLLRQLIRTSEMSDQAKSLLFHQRELDAFRDSFHDTLVREDYDQADTIIQSIEGLSGYSSEAGRMRQELADSRQATEQEKLETAIKRTNDLIEERDWVRAIRAVQILLQTYPDNPKVTALPERIQLAKARHKRELLESYDEAVRKNDIDRSIEMLRAMDPYLTPQEAAALEESARGVFRAKLHNLGVQFALCVADERWTDAISVGEQIVAEYPNSRMANEVNEKMDQLRGRAETLQT